MYCMILKFYCLQNVVCGNIELRLSSTCAHTNLKLLLFNGSVFYLNFSIVVKFINPALTSAYALAESDI